jgi:DNA-binding LacI/PurR family transcriptional regulator
MPKPITIKDIAMRVGVSTSAVSAVLGRNGSCNVRVSDATRGRILEAAAQLQYHPNRVALSLRYRKTNVFGLYTAHGYLSPNVPFTAQVIGGLHQGCDQHQKDLLLHGLYEGRHVEEIYGELADGRIDALALYTKPADALVELLAASTLPVIALVDALPGLPSVLADDAGGSRILARHLAGLGHREVIYISGSPPMVSARRRQYAFEDESARLGVKVIRSHQSARMEQFTEEDLTWLDLPPGRRPTAAVCWNDLTAYNLLDHCRQRGIKIPDDLAVAGFDGIPPPRPTPWKLTTIRAPWVDVARTAVTLLVNTLNGDEIPLETTLPVEFVQGDTT